MSRRKEKEYKYFEEEHDQSTDLHEAIVDLYLSVKVRQNEDSLALSDDQIDEERSNLRSTNSFTVLEYIRNSFDILMSLKPQSNKHIKRSSKDTEDLESMVQKYENDIRQHI